ncbi:HD domain-containing protein [Asanoa iriomotensis]|uniref:Phosphohydrolase n=1 Tax=Asanoa iriomotensis TaxID=234613 RepID=A0ABQ4C677_9ACTN|nr:phosphohydrolase [Asanoa iriomotensis]
MHHALTDPGDPPLRPLPDEVCDLLTALDAPPRLAAHLRAVHDVAWSLTAALSPHLPFDRAAVLYGAATHDIGKTVHVNELSGPGSAHERAGHELLLQRGVGPALARFARTHASWTLPDITIEDLLVSVADKIWKGKRVVDLEQKVVDHLVRATDQEPWQAFLTLDDVLSGLAANADDRLAFQARHPAA